MEKTVEKFLELDGLPLNRKVKFAVWWIPIEPICKHLNIDYETELFRLMENPTLYKHSSVQSFNDGDKKNFLKCVCLPERYIYSWLYLLDSDNTDLQKFKEEYSIVVSSHYSRSIYGYGKIMDKRWQEYCKNKICIKADD